MAARERISNSDKRRAVCCPRAKVISSSRARCRMRVWWLKLGVNGYGASESMGKYLAFGCQSERHSGDVSKRGCVDSRPQILAIL